jgi:hypothetical protein
MNSSGEERSNLLRSAFVRPSSACAAAALSHGLPDKFASPEENQPLDEFGVGRKIAVCGAFDNLGIAKPVVSC